MLLWELLGTWNYDKTQHKEDDKIQWSYELPPNRNESNQNENVCSWQPHGIIPHSLYPAPTVSCEGNCREAPVYPPTTTHTSTPD